MSSVIIFRISEAYCALDSQVFAAINRRANGNEVFVSRLGAQGLQGYARKGVHKLVRCKFISRFRLVRAKSNIINESSYPSIAMKSELINSSVEDSLIGYETLEAQGRLSASKIQDM
jgi:hypothetical protein